MDEYLLYYKKRLPLGSEWKGRWDVFVSAFNSSDRVREIHARVRATRRFWLMLPEYRYAQTEFPSGNTYSAECENEAEYLLGFLNGLGEDVSTLRLAIDITGLVSHYVLVLLELLRRAGVKSCDIFYGEPTRYLNRERTKFSDEAVLDVRQVSGFEGAHTTNTRHDLLVMAVGYDFRLVSEVANVKEHARKVQLFGLPSLRPDMYQESLLRASRVAEAVGPDASSPNHFEYAPAYDPFVTASVISSIVHKHRARCEAANVYLSPLSTKAQALGFAIYYLRECQNTPTSIIYPFCGTYMRETSDGLSGAWIYHVEFERFRDNAGGIL
jgi:hypothetical protein